MSPRAKPANPLRRAVTAMRNIRERHGERLEPKASMGAKLEPLSFWLRHRISPVNWMFRGLLDVVTHGEAPERNPFKTSGSQSSPPLP